MSQAGVFNGGGAILGPIRLGLAGAGAAGRAFVPAVMAHARFALAALAEPDEQARRDICARTGAAGFADLAQMLRGCDLDAVYIGTPTELHCEHALTACAAGKHVLTEKPMATSLAEAQAMVAAAQAAGVVLVVGHSHSHDPPVAAMRDIVAGGTLGRLRMIQTWCFSDWIYRPRRASELDPGRGGGVVFRQGAHQFDIIRLIGGGLVATVRAATFDWDPQRRSVGAHAALLQFADGAAASAIYNGYAFLPGAELCFDIGEWGEPRPPGRPPRTALGGERTGERADEIAAKRARARTAIPAAAPFQPFFGLTVVSCERGDLRQSPQGLYLYTAKGREEIIVPPCNPRSRVLDEFAGAILAAEPAVHDGRWGLATLEVCAAVLLSSQTGRDVALEHQVALPPHRPSAP